MEPRALEDALLDVARRAGVEVRREPFDSGVPREARPRGGLCRIHGVTVILVDTTLTTVERTAVLADALAGVQLDSLSMLPFVRERIDLAVKRRAAAKPARARHLRRV